MKTVLGALVALALLATAVPACAQNQNPTGVSITAGNAGVIAYAGSGAFPVNVTVGCATLLSNSNNDVLVSVIDAPAWLNVTETSVDVSSLDCDFGTAQATGAGSVPFKVSASAPAVSLQTVHFTVKLGDEPEPTTKPGATFTVAYESNYTLVPSVKFPLTVTNKTTTFTVVGTQASNAPSMIMVDDFSASNGALVSGIGAHQFQNKAGAPQSYTYTVTFTAPNDGDWTTANTTLKVFGHYNFDGMAGDPEDRMTLTWQFVNGGVPSEKSGGGKSSPAPVGAITALGLLGLAAALRRKA